MKVNVCFAINCVTLFFPVARRFDEYAALQSTLLTRKLPDEILLLSWSLLATVELCS